jgi:hypothetical protein
MAAAEKVVDAAETVADIIEETQDVIEETLDTIEGVHAWRCGLSRKQHVAQMAGIALITGSTVGFVVYRLTKRHLETKYEEIIAREGKEAKLFYGSLQEKPSPAEAARTLRPEVQDAADALVKYQGVVDSEEEEADAEPDKTVVETNIFTDNQAEDDFDLEAEKEMRDELKPYIISHEEFLEADPGYDQVQLTYYAGDDTLADEADKVIPAVNQVIGDANLCRFGAGSGDPRTVYVRNDQMATDFEIAKSDGKYAHEVLGFQHSADFQQGRDRRNRPRRGGKGGDE